MSTRNFEAVIGLEVHVQLKTKSKIFCSDSTQYDAADNENTSPVSVGMPGTLPVVNRKAIEYSIKTGLALNCQIRQRSVFARKNYFYPDLPKGYQISQYDKPLCENGSVTFLVDGHEKTVSITRAHMEEDAGKSIHQSDCTLLNYNRSGIPLLEIVSGPDMRSPKEAAEYARTIAQIVQYLDVCDGNLEEGSIRCDCNVSVRKVGATQLGVKVEIKNINSFRFVEKAIEYEIDRQSDAVERGVDIVQETRLYDPDKNRTFSMRSKENAQEYRYFPDPDLLPIVVTSELIDKMKAEVPELPLAKAKRFQTVHGLPEYDCQLLTAESNIADFFEKTVLVSGNPKGSSNWIMTELMRELKESKKTIVESPITFQSLGRLILLIDQGVISGKIGKGIFAEMWLSGKGPDEIIKEKNVEQITDSVALEGMVDQVLANNPKEVLEFKAGKVKLMGFFVGAVMKISKGQASPEQVNKILNDRLKKTS
jgi:aspartyl-tRNA(Asn)/glutamyl-tRNA(Gln) amidotransferase subunit B